MFNNFTDETHLFLDVSFFKKKRYNKSDSVLTELFSLKPKNAMSLAFRETKPSLVNLIKLVPCIITIDDPRIQIMDDEFCKLPVSLISVPDDTKNTVEPDIFW